MWETKFSIKTKVNKEVIWKVWSDVENWKEWDKSVEWSSIDGRFELGAKGKLKPKEGPLAKFKLTEVEKFKKFTDEAKLPLTKLQFIHEMNCNNGDTEITHKIRITGILTFLFSRVIGKKLEKDLPHAMENLSQVLEKESQSTKNKN